MQSKPGDGYLIGFKSPGITPFFALMHFALMAFRSNSTLFNGTLSNGTLSNGTPSNGALNGNFGHSAAHSNDFAEFTLVYLEGPAPGSS